MAEEDYSNLSDEELLKKIQPAYTSDVDKYFIELAHSIVDEKPLYLPDRAIPDLREAMEEFARAIDQYEHLIKTNADKDVLNDMKTEVYKAKEAFELATKNATPKQTDFKSTVEKSSAFFPEIKVKAGLKTRKRKRRNGSSRVRRHRITRVSKKQNKTRNR